MLRMACWAISITLETGILELVRRSLNHVTTLTSFNSDKAFANAHVHEVNLQEVTLEEVGHPMAAVKKTLQLYKDLESKLQDERQQLVSRLSLLDKKTFVVVTRDGAGQIQDGGIARADNSSTSITNATQIHLEITDLKLKYVRERTERLAALCSENPKSPTPDELSYDRYTDFVERNQRIVQLSLRLYDLEKLKYDLKQRNTATSLVANRSASVDFVAESIQRIQLLIQRHKRSAPLSTRRYIQELLRPQANRKTLESVEVQTYVAECLQNANSPTNAAGQQIGVVPRRYRSFMEVLTNYIVQKQRESQNEELEYNVVYGVLEAEVMPQIKDVAWQHVAEQARDDVIRKQCDRFADVTMKQLRVKRSLQSKELVPFIGCISHLRATCFYPNPTDKMYSIVAAAKALYDQLGDTRDLSIDGDSFLDLWVYAILKANIPDAVSNLQFMKEYGNSRLGNDEAGYYLTTMEAALLFIEGLTPDKLGMQTGPLEFVVPEYERFIGLSELQGCCLVTARSGVKLPGYLVVAVKDWILDRSRLYRCALLYTGSPHDVATVSVVRLEKDRAPASHLECIQGIFLKPQKKGLQCISTPDGHAVVVNLAEWDVRDFIVWPADKSWTDLEYLMRLIYAGSEQTDPTLNRKEGIPVTRKIRSGSTPNHDDVHHPLSPVSSSFNPQSYVTLSPPVQEKQSLSGFRGVTSKLVVVNADVHVQGDRPSPTNTTVPQGGASVGSGGMSDSHSALLLSLQEASKEFCSPQYQSLLECNFAKNHLSRTHIGNGILSLQDVIRQVQIDLQRLCHLSFSCPLDGLFTAELQRAILHFQEAHNASGKVVWPLPETGYLTKATRVELHEHLVSVCDSLVRATGTEIGQDFDLDSTKTSDIQLFRDYVAQFQAAHHVNTCHKGALCEQTILAIKSCLRQSIRHTF